MNDLSKARATTLEVGEESEAQRLDNFLLRHLKGVPKSHVYRVVRSGEVRVNSGRVKPDYRVRIGDTVGDVIDKSLLVTHIRTVKNEDVTIPNAMIMNTHVVNYSARAKEEGLILHTSVTIGYDAPWRTVHELLLEAARKTACVLLEPKPFVLQTALNDFYVTYELNAYTDEPREMVNTCSSLHRNIQDSFNEAGVEIMSPHYAQLRDGNKTAIPAAYLPPGHVSRSHRVVQVPEEPGKTGESR